MLTRNSEISGAEMFGNRNPINDVDSLGTSEMRLLSGTQTVSNFQSQERLTDSGFSMQPPL